MMVEPLVRCMAAIRAEQDQADLARTPVILFSPAGKPLTQERVQTMAQGHGAVLLCGRYEGVDQRFIDAFVDEEVSMGDYVLGRRAARPEPDRCRDPPAAGRVARCGLAPARQFF